MQTGGIKSLDYETVRMIRRLVKKEDKKYLFYLDELEKLIANNEPGEWFKKPYSDIVTGDVWEQPIGEIRYHKNKHTFAYMYVPDQGTAIKKHTHCEYVHGNRNLKKTSELYIYYYPNGRSVTFEYCGKNTYHQLVNKYKAPIYVISVKVTGKN